MKKQICTFTIITALSALSSQGAITLVGTAPTLDEADQGNMTWSTSNSDFYWTDRPNPGQTFTTGSNAGGYTITEFSYQLNSTRSVAETITNTFRLSSISGTTSTTIVNQTGETWDGVHNSGDWITFTFDAPVTLAANTQYGVDLEHTGGGAWQNGITSVRRNGDTFAGGSGYTKADGNPTTITSDSNDRIFHVNMTAIVIPEPSTTALIGLGGLALILRRRK